MEETSSGMCHPNLIHHKIMGMFAWEGIRGELEQWRLFRRRGKQGIPIKGTLFIGSVLQGRVFVMTPPSIMFEVQ
jgi:hypothetical protein